MPSSLYEGKTPLVLNFEGYESIVQNTVCYFEYRKEEQKKRKRSFCVTEDDEIIDKAFKSRLIQKLGFEGSPDYDMSVFGDEFGESWSNYKDDLEKNFTDQSVLQYLKTQLSKISSDTRKAVHLIVT